MNGDFYDPEKAERLTALVLDRLPMRFPDVHSDSRDDWEVNGAAMLVRASEAVRTLFRLTPQDSWLPVEAITRTVLEMAITFAWLAADPSRRVEEWISGNDKERLKADNKVRRWLPERNRVEEPQALLSDEIRELVEAEARDLMALSDRAVAADSAWKSKIPELQQKACSFTDFYALAYPHYSFAIHALHQPLYRFVGIDDEGVVFVGQEGRERRSSPWSTALIFYGISLLVSAEAFGWPDPNAVRAVWRT